MAGRRGGKIGSSSKAAGKRRASTPVLDGLDSDSGSEFQPNKAAKVRRRVPVDDGDPVAPVYAHLSSIENVGPRRNLRSRPGGPVRTPSPRLRFNPVPDRPGRPRFSATVTPESARVAGSGRGSRVEESEGGTSFAGASRRSEAESAGGSRHNVAGPSGHVADGGESLASRSREGVSSSAAPGGSSRSGRGVGGSASHSGSRLASVGPDGSIGHLVSPEVDMGDAAVGGDDAFGDIYSPPRGEEAQDLSVVVSSFHVPPPMDRAPYPDNFHRLRQSSPVSRASGASRSFSLSHGEFSFTCLAVVPAPIRWAGLVFSFCAPSRWACSFRRLPFAGSRVCASLPPFAGFAGL